MGALTILTGLSIAAAALWALKQFRAISANNKKYAVKGTKTKKALTVNGTRYGA